MQDPKPPPFAPPPLPASPRRTFALTSGLFPFYAPPVSLPLADQVPRSGVEGSPTGSALILNRKRTEGWRMFRIGQRCFAKRFRML